MIEFPIYQGLIVLMGVFLLGFGAAWTLQPWSLSRERLKLSTLRRIGTKVMTNHMPPLESPTHTQVVHCTNCNSYSGYEDNSTVYSDCVFCGEHHTKKKVCDHGIWKFNLDKFKWGWHNEVLEVFK